MRQILTESVLLALLGCATGLLLARSSAGLLVRASGIQLRSFVNVNVDLVVVVVILVVSLIAGLLFGLFAVDGARNALHVATGIFGIGMGSATWGGGGRNSADCTVTVRKDGSVESISAVQILIEGKNVALRGNRCEGVASSRFARQDSLGPQPGRLGIDVLPKARSDIDDARALFAGKAGDAF